MYSPHHFRGPSSKTGIPFLGQNMAKLCLCVYIHMHGNIYIYIYICDIFDIYIYMWYQYIYIYIYIYIYVIYIWYIYDMRYVYIYIYIYCAASASPLTPRPMGRGVQSCFLSFSPSPCCMYCNYCIVLHGIVLYVIVCMFVLYCSV